VVFLSKESVAQFIGAAFPELTSCTSLYQDAEFSSPDVVSDEGRVCKEHFVVTRYFGHE
jgi:hypothetical protein